MAELFKPRSIEQAREAIAWAAAEDVPLELAGRATRRALGRPTQTRMTLDFSELAGIVSYEPEELVLTARAGTPLADIEAAIVARNQMLAFEPPDLSTALGAADRGTIGGAIAVGLSGPRRIKAGAARDHLLGFSAVSGRGEVFKAGGKVVKNVTGYDLPKLACGSFGTLAALTEVTVKVLPAAPKTRTVLVFDLDLERATAAMADALNSPFEISGAAHLPPAIAARSAVDFVRGAGTSVTALRIEGTPVSVAARCAGLRKLLAPRGRDEELHSMRATTLWREIRDVGALLPDVATALWRISIPPAAAPRLVSALAGAHYVDWGGGLIWLATAAREDCGAASIRAALASCGGHATLIRASDAVRASVPVFEPQPPAMAALTRRVKDGFDPKRILNPGRMYAGL